MQNMTWAISRVVKPSEVPRMRKKERSEAPITTSGVAIGITIRKFAARRPRNWWRTRAIAIIVPITVEISVASSASLIEVQSASFSSGMPKTFSQCSRVKPTQVKLKRPAGSLKEKAKMTAIGTSR